MPFGSCRTWNLTGIDDCVPVLGSVTGISNPISTSTAVPRMPIVATGVVTFMSPCFAVSPATNEMVPATRLSSEELFDPLAS